MTININTNINTNNTLPKFYTNLIIFKHNLKNHIRQNIFNLNLSNIIVHNVFSEEFIIEIIDYLDLKKICKSNKLSREFYDKYIIPNCNNHELLFDNIKLEYENSTIKFDPTFEFAFAVESIFESNFTNHYPIDLISLVKSVLIISNQSDKV